MFPDSINTHIMYTDTIKGRKSSSQTLLVFQLRNISNIFSFPCFQRITVLHYIHLWRFKFLIQMLHYPKFNDDLSDPQVFIFFPV